MQHAIRPVKVSVVGVVFDPVRAVACLLAHRQPRAFYSVHRLNAVRHVQLPGVAQQWIHPGGSHGACGHKHARPRHLAPIDGCLHVHVRVHGAFGFQIAHGGEPVRQSDVRIARREDGAVRDGLLQELLIVIRGGHISLQQDVRVRVNESRQHRGAAQFNHIRPRRCGASRCNRNNFVRLDENPGIGDRLVAFAVNQFSGVNGRPPRCLRARHGAKHRHCQHPTQYALHG